MMTEETMSKLKEGNVGVIADNEESALVRGQVGRRLNGRP